MTFSQRAVEAAWRAYQNTPIDLLADSDEETKRCVVNALTAALAVDGVVLVPAEPTPDMRIAGGIAWAEAAPSSETYVDTADACYKAMIAVTTNGGQQ